jgi:hypothetical protein
MLPSADALPLTLFASSSDSPLVLALVLVLGASLPMWALGLWMAKSSQIGRWVAAGSWLIFVLLACELAAILVAGLLFAWVHHDLLGPGRPMERRIVYGVWTANGLLFIVAVAWAKKRSGVARVAPPGARRPKPTPRMISVVLLVWVALAGGFALFKVGPLATTPASERDLYALAVSGAVIATLIVLLRASIREKWKEATKDGAATPSEWDAMLARQKGAPRSLGMKNETDPGAGESHA